MFSVAGVDYFYFRLEMRPRAFDTRKSSLFDVGGTRFSPQPQRTTQIVEYAILVGATKENDAESRNSSGCPSIRQMMHALKGRRLQLSRVPCIIQELIGHVACNIGAALYVCSNLPVLLERCNHIKAQGWSGCHGWAEQVNRWGQAALNQVYRPLQRRGPSPNPAR